MLTSKSLPELDSERNPDQTPTLNVFLFQGTDVDQEDPATLRLCKPLVLSADLRHPQIHRSIAMIVPVQLGYNLLNFLVLRHRIFPLWGRGRWMRHLRLLKT